MSVVAIDSGTAAPSAAPPVEVSGAERRPMAPAGLKVVQILTGWLVIRWLAWLVARHLFGYGVQSSLTLEGTQLRYRARGHLLGREVRNVDEVWLARDLVSLGVERRFPHLLLLLGAAGLLAGAAYGITAVIDGIQASYLAISLVGLGLLATGVLFDLALGSLAGYVGHRAALRVTLRSTRGWWPGQSFRILGVDEAQARAFVDRVRALR